MKTLIVYDSVYGSTEKIARVMTSAITPVDEVTVLRVGEANLLQLSSLDLVIVGSPTQGGRPTPAIQDFINKIPVNALRNIGVSAFDTRFAAQAQGIGLRLLMRVLGYAAERIAQSLQDKGGYLVTPPAGFIVEGKEGPLKAGELERAAAWLIATRRASSDFLYANRRRHKKEDNYVRQPSSS